MNAGVYKATTGLLHQAARLDAISENLANVAKPGYRRTVVSTRPFIGAMQDALAKVNYEDGVRVHNVAVDFTVGPMRHTGRSLDFALEGEKAFFVLEKDGETFYTRDGAFAVDNEGRLVNASGFKVAGDVSIPPNTTVADLTVGTDGTLYNGIQPLGKLEVAVFAEPQRLQRVGPSLFKTAAGVEAETPGQDVRVHNRMLEGSNTSIFTEMAEMIECMRNFEACQKMINIQDASEGAMISKLGQV